MSLACTDRGQGPPLLLLHGFPLDRTLWNAQIEPLAQTHRVLAPDLRGHGESPPSGDDYSMEALADDLLNFLDERKCPGPFALAGHSMGGYIALALAARCPERISHLMLIATRAAADSPEAAANRLRLAREAEQRNDITPVIEAFLPRLLGPTSQANSPNLIRDLRTMMNRTSLTAVVGCLRGMADRPDRTPLLKTLTMPSLVIAGAEDLIAPPTEGQSMSQALPHGQLTIIPDSGHLVSLEQPDLTTQTIIDFLSPTNPVSAS